MKLTRKLAAVELANGEVYTDVRIINPDLMRYHTTAQKHGWPHMTVKDGVATVPHINYEETFTCWAALTRLGLYAGKWEEFRDHDCIALVVEDEQVDPTNGGGMPLAGGDSYSSSPPNTPDSASAG